MHHARLRTAADGLGAEVSISFHLLFLIFGHETISGKWRTGLPDVCCFQTKNQTLGKFWRVLQWKMLVYFIGTWSLLQSFCYILWTFGIVRGNLAYFSRFGILHQERSGNPDGEG
jgi:hypothetical protein